MNRMPEVARILDVEIGEEFNIKGCIDELRFKFTEDDVGYFYGDTWVSISCYLCNLLNGKWELVKIPKPILDDVEKKYLSKVIRPFRDRIVYISKENVENSNKEYIYIGLWGTDKSTLPPFERETMYKGMKLNQEYTLEELGL